ncbi:MAG: histidinol-phosphatase, partial [Rhizobiales bacterium]|nr:histidinol-phosphatase [Hyphomicrobiales bacterium]
ECACRAADAAAKITLAHFRKAGVVENKADAVGGFDPVTKADRDAEAAMRAIIEQACPDHTIRGEEQAERTGSSDFVWHIDPIDGTRSFIVGVPLWGTLIGLEYQEKPILGVLDQPHIGERFVGSPDGATLIGRAGRIKLAASGCTRLDEARLGTTSPLLFAPGEEHQAYQRIESATRLARYGGDCYFYAMLAAGHLDLVVEAGLNPYDIVALIPIIEAAGGTITCWDGSSAHRGGRVVAAATSQLHAEVLAALSGG